MKEVLYTISGKRLPVVFNIGARALTSHSLNVHAGHDDVMSVADCGWGMLFARNAQEAGDLCLICPPRRRGLATRRSSTCRTASSPRTPSKRCALPEPEFMKEFVGKPEEKLINLMDPANPMMSGVVQNQDSYMKGKIAQRWYYDRVTPALAEAFEEFCQQDGPQVRLRRRRTAARTPSTSWSAWAATWRRPRRRSTTCATSKGMQGRLPERLLLPPVPGAADRRRPQALQGVHGLSSGWTIRSRRPATI